MAKDRALTLEALRVMDAIDRRGVSPQLLMSWAASRLH